MPPSRPRRAAPAILLALLPLAPATALAEGLVPRAAEPISVSRVTTAQPVVALTFDACPTRSSRGFDRQVFDILRREKVPATVFVSGRWVEKHWREARELAAEPLIEFGNHSYRHPPFSRLNVDRVRQEIAATDKLIAALGRQSVGVRPPFGDWAAWLPAATGGQPVVLWDVVSGDAGGHIAPDAMVNTVSAATRPGSIVVFHINGRGPHTKKALPRIIRRLRARGLRFVHVSALLGLEGGQIVKAEPRRYTKRIPSAPPLPRDELQDRVGEGGLGPPEPERGRVREPFEGSREKDLYDHQYDHPPGEPDPHADKEGDPGRGAPPG